MAEYIDVAQSDAADESMNLPVRRLAAASAGSAGLVNQAAFVDDADSTSLATLAADIDELRDSLIAAGIMAAS